MSDDKPYGDTGHATGGPTAIGGNGIDSFTQTLGVVVGTWAVMAIGTILIPLSSILVPGGGGYGVWSDVLSLSYSGGALVGALLGLLLAVSTTASPLVGAGRSALTNGLGYILFSLLNGGVFLAVAGSRSVRPLGEILTGVVVIAIPIAITAGGVTGLGLALVGDGRR